MAPGQPAAAPAAAPTFNPLSIQQAFAGKHILLAGASGFLGKVWLVMLLDRIEEIGCIYVLLRKKGAQSVGERFEKMVNNSYVFSRLHEKHGANLSVFIAKRVKIVEGDVSQPGLGMVPAVGQRLRRELDLVVNCAGLVEFNPDLRDALSTNIDGTLYAADFTAACNHAALLHVSTCYVAGTRQGTIDETVVTHTAPNGAPFDVDQELKEIRTLIDHLTKTFPRRRAAHDALTTEGCRRAEHWGWPNTYTYTKALAEMLLVQRYKNLRYTIFRPSIVESSLRYPIPGWNEGFNTCGPLAYLLSTWFRYLPAKVGNPFDVVPVDLVGNGMSIAAAAVMQNRHSLVYQCGTSDKNLLTIDRAAKLTSLSHRIYYWKNGKTLVEKLVRSRWGVKSVGTNHPFLASNMRDLVQELRRIAMDIAPRGPRPIQIAKKRVSEFSTRTDRRLAKVEKMLELFMPFIHDNHHIFETRNLSALQIAEEEFHFEPETIDWRDYWLTVQIPGLRRWSFPLIEGKEVESYAPTVTFHLPEAQPSEVA